jgi:anti-sigma factor RsiW
MVHPEITDARLEAFLDEALPAAELAEIERWLRSDQAGAARLAALHARRNDGLHTIGAIWRRHRLTCPDRNRLGNYLLNILSEAEVEYLRVHLEVVGCPYCRANLADLERAHREPAPTRAARQQRIFRTSAGLLTGKK